MPRVLEAADHPVAADDRAQREADHEGDVDLRGLGHLSEVLDEQDTLTRDVDAAGELMGVAVVLEQLRLENQVVTAAAADQKTLDGRLPLHVEPDEAAAAHPPAKVGETMAQITLPPV